MYNKTLIILILGLLLVGSVSAMYTDYYFHPECSHCKSIENYMTKLSNSYNINWVDTSEPKSYPISGTPTAIIHTDDNRNIVLVGSYEIPRYLECELQEMSTLECPTTTTLNRGSYFIE